MDIQEVEVLKQKILLLENDYKDRIEKFRVALREHELTALRNMGNSNKDYLQGVLSCVGYVQEDFNNILR